MNDKDAKFLITNSLKDIFSSSSEEIENSQPLSIETNKKLVKGTICKVFINKNINLLIDQNLTENNVLEDWLAEFLNANKKELKLNRFVSFGKGTSPYFFFVNSKIYPTKNWFTNVKSELKKNQDCVLPRGNLEVKVKFSCMSEKTSILKVKNEKHFSNLNNFCLTNDQTKDIEENLKHVKDLKIIESFHKQNENFCHLSEEQFVVFKTVLNLLFDNSTKSLRVLNINGPAGSGKTTVIAAFKKLARVKIIYATITNNLCDDIKKKFNIEVSTVFKFIKTSMNLNYEACKLLINCLSHISVDDFEKIENYYVRFNNVTISNTSERKALLRWKKIRMKYCKKSLLYSHHLIFFLDEFSLMSEGLIGFTKFLIEKISNILFGRCILIISGDLKQIQPFNCLKNTNNYSFLKFPFSEHVFNFEKQFRIENIEYENLLKTLITCENPRIYLKNEFPQKTPNINYYYPIDILSKFPGDSTSLSVMIEWFETNNIAKIACPLIFFSFTNDELHYNNIALAFDIINQLKKYNIKASDYVVFQILFEYNFMNYKLEKKLYDSIEDTNCPKLPILPLIKFFPYKILVDYMDLPRSSIVYLLFWTNEFVFVYRETTQSVHCLKSINFKMNLLRSTNIQFYGFPIQLLASETSFSAQGLTIDKNIYANLSSASLSEAYVILSRVATKNKCKNIFVP